MRPWLQDGRKVANSGVPLLCARCPCVPGCECTTAEHLTDPATLPRQTSYVGMYSAYNTTNFTKNGYIYTHEWDWDYYNYDNRMQETDWVDLGSTGDAWGLYAGGIYAKPAQSISTTTKKTYPAPACAYLRRRYGAVKLRHSSADPYEIYTVPVVQPHITSHDCSETWGRREMVHDPYLMVPVTIEIILHGYIGSGVYPVDGGLMFAANCITPTGPRRSWDIQTFPTGDRSISPLVSLQVNGIECVQPQWRRDWPTSADSRHYYEVPAGTIIPGRLFAPPTPEVRVDNLDLYTGGAWFRVKCLGDYDPGTYIHLRGTGLVATIPADGDLDSLVPIIDAGENNYIEP